MDCTIPVSAVVLTISSLFAVSSAAQTGAQETEIKGVIVVPSGTRLDPSVRYRVDLRVGDKSLPARFRAEPAPGKDAPAEAKKTDEPASVSPGQPQTGKARTPNRPEPPPPSGAPVWMWVALGLVVAAAVVAAALLYYYRRVVPRREIDPYWRALEAIRDRRYQDALPGLTSIESKLAVDLRYDARFFIALCHYHLEEPGEAEHVAAALHRERPRDENAAYLLAQVRVERGLDAEAEPVLESMKQNGQLGIRDARRLMGIVKFRRGVQAMRAGDIDAASGFFAEVEALGDFAPAIPADLRNRHVSLGTRALFDRDLPAARQHFEALRAAAAGMPEDQGKALLVKAAVGLALADWVEDDPERSQRLEQTLVETCRLLHPEGPDELPWPEPVPGSAKGDAESLKRALEEADRNFDLPPEEKGIRRCLRDLHLLRALVTLRLWARMDGKQAAAAIPDRLKATLSRLACARALDERFSDCYLIAGLLMFYFHQPGPDRTTGVDLLEEARKLGVRDPDAMEILNNRERIERENADAVDRYQQVLDRYLRDETVRTEVRRALLQRLSTHRSLMNRYKPPDLSRARTVPPTVDEMTARSETLRERVRAIRDASSPELQRRSEDLKRQGELFARQAQTLQAAESELLAITGEELFKDV